MASAKSKANASAGSKAAKSKAKASTAGIKTKPSKTKPAYQDDKLDDEAKTQAKHDREIAETRAAEPAADIALHEAAQEGENAFFPEASSPEPKSQAKAKSSTRRTKVEEGESALVEGRRKATTRARPAINDDEPAPEPTPGEVLSVAAKKVRSGNRGKTQESVSAARAGHRLHPPQRPSAAQEGESALSAKEAINAAREAILSARAALTSAKDVILSAKDAIAASHEASSTEKKNKLQELSGTLRTLVTSVKNATNSSNTP